jgi:hypothetical protein
MSTGVYRRAGLHSAQLSRFVRGQRSLMMAAVERLADQLGFELVLKPKRSKKKGGAK